MTPLVVVNGSTATFDCSFGRGCDGLCCKQGEPSVSVPEQARIEAVLSRALPHLRPEAKVLIENSGWLGDDVKLSQPMVRTVEDWCVFFNKGCVLHKIGAEDGDFVKYKPIQCVLFPLEPNGDGTWYVRQWHHNDEQWNDIFCLNPANTTRNAVEALAPELELARQLGPGFSWPTGEEE